MRVGMDFVGTQMKAVSDSTHSFYYIKLNHMKLACSTIFEI